MTIKIINTEMIIDENGLDIFRHVDIIISDDVNVYMWGVGGLPLTGDLQLILDNREAELWTAASAKGNAVPLPVTFKQEARQFMVDNPAAKALIELSLPDLEMAIQNRTEDQETLLLKTLAVAVRFLYAELR